MNPCYVMVNDDPHEITRESSASIWTKPVAIRNGDGGIERLEAYGAEKCFNRETRRQRGSSLRRARLGRMMTGVEVINHLKEQQRKLRAEAEAHKAKAEALAEQLRREWEQISRQPDFSITPVDGAPDACRLRVSGTNYRRPGVWEVLALVQPAAYRNSGYDIEAAGVFVGKDDQGDPAYSTTRITASLSDLEHGALYTRQMALATLIRVLRR